MSDHPPHPARRVLGVAVKLALSVGLMAFVLRDTRLGALWQTLRRVQLVWVLAALGAHAVMMAVSVWRWDLLLRAQHVEVPTRTLSESFWVASFFNNFLPSNIGGDVVRVADTASAAGSKTLATTVVLLDRLLGLVALLAVAAAASGVAYWFGVRLDGMQYVWVGLIALVTALLVVFRHPGTVGRVVDRVQAGRSAGIQRRLQQLLAAMHRFAGEPRSLWSAFAGAVAVQLLLVVFYVFAARSLSVPLPWLAASIIVPVSFVVQMVPISVNGFGVREAVFAFFFASLGLDVSAALTLSLGSAALVMLFSLSGGAVFLLRARGLLPAAEPA